MELPFNIINVLCGFWITYVVITMLYWCFGDRQIRRKKNIDVLLFVLNVVLLLIASPFVRWRKKKASIRELRQREEYDRNLLVRAADTFGGEGGRPTQVRVEAVLTRMAVTFDQSCRMQEVALQRIKVGDRSEAAIANYDRLTAQVEQDRASFKDARDLAYRLSLTLVRSGDHRTYLPDAPPSKATRRSGQKHKAAPARN